MMRQNSLEFKFKQILKGWEPKPLVLAVSGGVDSMVMLDLFCKHYTGELKIAHFDHGIRKESSLDKSLISQVSQDNNVEVVFGSANVPELTGNLEANARKERYKFLESCRPKNGFVVTAHHSDDQIETVFMNFLKGSFVSGLAGLAKLDFKRNLWRPLIDFSKSEILEYAATHSINYLNDITNFSSEFNRNFCRNEILPVLKNRFGSLSVIARNSIFYSELDSYLENAVSEFLDTELVENFLKKSSLLGLPSFMRFKIYQRLNPGYDLSVADFLELDELVTNNSSGKFRLLGKVRFEVKKDKLLILT